MTLDDLAARLVELLDATGVPYMVVGSVASSFYGEPRMTRDLDIVIDPEPANLRRLVAALEAAAFYSDADAAHEALAQRTQFNVIDPSSGWKVDLIIRLDRPFSIQEFARRREADLPFGAVCLATAEDTILAKLEWAKSGLSERQLRDVAGIVDISGDQLDAAYIDRWARELGVSALWDSVRAGR
jgi:hypothetical protein